MSSSIPSFDALHITQQISNRLGFASNGEVHLFAYLACLLSLFDGVPVAEWGYGFAGLETGAPFSPELQSAKTELLEAGFLTGFDSNLIISEVGAQQLTELKEFSIFKPRLRHLDAACSTLLAFPIGMVRSAMEMEPGLRPVISMPGARPLLAEAALEQLHDHFDALLTAVGQTSDLLVPATVWLSYLAQRSREHDRKVITESLTVDD